MGIHLGDVVGHYNVLRLIGRGGTGEVYYARDINTNQAVALKTLNEQAAITNPSAFRRFLLEAEALRQLNHPNIVTLQDTFQTDGRHILVLDYIPAGSLWALLAQRPQLPIIHALMIALAVVNALKQAHGLGLVHRDIKPANILLDENGKPYLSDFGLVAMLESQDEVITPDGALLGSYSYLSPEAVNSLPADPSMDIWSLGVVLYEMLAGVRPFVGDKPASIIFKIMTQDPAPLRQHRPDISPELESLVTKILNKDTTQRVGDAAAVETALLQMVQSLSDNQRAEYDPDLYEKLLELSPIAIHKSPRRKSSILRQLAEPTIELSSTLQILPEQPIKRRLGLAALILGGLLVLGLVVLLLWPA